MLSALDLTKRIGTRTILKEVTFRLNSGSLLTITGANGVGKTTLLRMLAGITRPTAGKVLFNDQPLEPSRPDLRRHIGYVGHESQVYPDLTGYENLQFFAAAYGIEQPAQRINDALEYWGLAEAGNQLVRTYSRGMRQRLALGRAALHGPALLLLDEPTTGLDESAKTRLFEFLSQQCHEGGVVVLTTHDPLVSQQLDGLRAALSGGRLVIAT